jgi:hypothetical protein
VQNELRSKIAHDLRGALRRRDGLRDLRGRFARRAARKRYRREQDSSKHVGLRFREATLTGEDRKPEPQRSDVVLATSFRPSLRGLAERISIEQLFHVVMQLQRRERRLEAQERGRKLYGKLYGMP